MSVLKIKDSQGNWVGVPSIKGDKGDTGPAGPKGDSGTDGISPTVTITPITGGHRITITDKDGEHSADVMNGTGNVDDVFYGLAKAAGDTTQSQSSNAVGNYTEDAKSAIQTMLGIADLIGNSEGATASQAYSVGDVFLHKGKLYKVTASIAQGSAIVPNKNCSQTTIIDLLRGV